MGVKISNSGVEMGDLVGKSSIGLLQLNNPGLSIAESTRDVTELSSASSELGGELSNCSIEVGDLVGELSNSGL